MHKLLEDSVWIVSELVQTGGREEIFADIEKVCHDSQRKSMELYNSLFTVLSINIVNFSLTLHAGQQLEIAD